MKWFEHQTTDKDGIEARLIRKRFGNEGWGVWQNLNEEIGKNMGNENVSEWGCVSSTHTMESLAEACYCTLEYFTAFVQYCDEMTILSRRNGLLFSPFVLERMNEYASRVKTKTDRTKKTKSTEIPYSTEKTETTKSSASHTHTQSHTHIKKEINKEKTFKRIEDLTDDVIRNLGTEIGVSFSDASYTRNKMKDWLAATGKSYKDYRAALRNWINRSLEEGKIKRITRKEGTLADLVPDGQ